jgi:hypothetical protein
MRFTVCVAALAIGCGGATASDTDGGAADATSEAAAPRDGSSDVGVDAGCPPGTPPIPSAAVYACDAGAPPDAGCRAASGDPNASHDPNIYPIGCVVTLPTMAPFCGGGCCGPQTCNCETFPGPNGFQFTCPL